MRAKQPNPFDCPGWRAFILRNTAVDALVNAALAIHAPGDDAPLWLDRVRTAAHAAALPHGADNAGYLAAYAKAIGPLVARAATGITLH